MAFRKPAAAELLDAGGVGAGLLAGLLLVVGLVVVVAMLVVNTRPGYSDFAVSSDTALSNSMRGKPMLRKIPWGDIARIACIIAGTLLGIQFCPPPSPPPGVPPTPPGFPVPPLPTPPPPPTPKPDPLAAIVRISGQGAGCSATVIGPRRPDGRYDVLTAYHCIQAGGRRWTMRFRDGRTVGATYVNGDARADWAWLVTDTNSEELPFALLLDRPWKVGEKVWHAGFGVDKPANTEYGEIIGGPSDRNQVIMRLNVSSGDSGGGIALTEDGRVVSTVCCTYRIGANLDTRGATPEAIRSGRGAVQLSDDWAPIPLPQVMPGKD